MSDLNAVIQEFLHSRTARGIKPTTIRGERGVLRAFLTVRDALTFDPDRPDCNDRCYGEPCVHQTTPLQRSRNDEQGEGGATTPPGLDKPSMKYGSEVE